MNCIVQNKVNPKMEGKMKNIFHWVKKHKLLTVFIVLVLFITPLLIIHILFKSKSPNEWLVAEWSAGDLLGYVGAFLTFTGTVGLGAVAVLQNERFQLNNKEEKIANTKRPFLFIEKVTHSDGTVLPFNYDHYFLESNDSHFWIYFKNAGDGIANNISFPSEWNWLGKALTLKSDYCLAPDKVVKVEIETPNLKANGNVISDVVTYQNILGYSYSQVIKYKIYFKHNCDEKTLNKWVFNEDYLGQIYPIGSQKSEGFKEF